MSDVGLFVAGVVVTVIVLTGLVALWYAALLDGRAEQSRESRGTRPGSDADPSAPTRQARSSRG